ncbi:MAG: 16S rRNA (guanine(966)-N(2))-methyltransferase RsmD [Chloroflexi bacterium]|nr:16S rRNA (guanine(966)-N(2))-methyltransferase RsmD [Chloroflexota bacterium]
MRIVGGKAKGMMITVAPVAGLRPTTDRVRSAIFSMLASRDAIDGARTLDLFAGTGALGIEALSQGAASADFVERNARVSDVIRQNLARAGLGAEARVLNMTVSAAIERVEDPYDLILMDPPYADSAGLGEVIDHLFDRGLVRAGTVIVVEHASRDARDFSQPGLLEQMQSKRYGDTAVSLYRVSAGRA